MNTCFLRYNYGAVNKEIGKQIMILTKKYENNLKRDNPRQEINPTRYS